MLGISGSTKTTWISKDDVFGDMFDEAFNNMDVFDGTVDDVDDVLMKR
ncbi:MAG: hypothetical protein BSOLF_1351 [Candidatus Carbobacillus altaicus]|uniref:Uncharacterized protein n=1 Tax=Candidatus Carbonibacillus altaicus TaxID=2163959 RepID=A0A2R6Y494_9BACL|nr:MAG: hypothetical protein BSOLF_1351 [Candidatus Carbobacillus altaicus]